MFDGVIADCTHVQSIPDRAMKVIEFKGLQEPQDLHVFSLPRLAHTGLKEAAQGCEHSRQIPAHQRCRLIQGSNLLLQQWQIMDRVEDQILPVIGTGMAGDLLTGATNDDLMDIATDPDRAITESGV